MVDLQKSFDCGYRDGRRNGMMLGSIGTMIVGFLFLLIATPMPRSRPEPEKLNWFWAVDVNGDKHKLPESAAKTLLPVNWAMSMDMLHGSELESCRWAFTRECKANPGLSWDVSEVFQIHDKIQRSKK